MHYQSLQFILFAGVVLLVYYRVKPARQAHVLLLANLIFYALSGVEYLPFIAATAVCTFWTGRRIGRIYRETDAQIGQCGDPAQKKQLRAQSKARARRALVPGMAVTIGLLCVCKYALFVSENVNVLLSALNIPRIPTFRMILPLGISFYSFMALSYVLDVYWKRYEAEERFLAYATYLSYFPHVVQGPIDRFNEFKAQLAGGVTFCARNLTFGAQLALWGFFKKLVIADRLALFVDTAFSHFSEYSGPVLVAAVALYSIQIYADFSGCIDIVTGVSEMFGIHLRKNFNHPYFSRTMGEFWRRWHISLQEWFKDYVYFPVSASNLMRRAKKRFRERGMKRASELFAACFPILVVWMITGLWHGAAWKYVAWGLFHAILLIGSKVLEPAFAAVNRRLRINADCRLWRLWQMLRTFFLCCVGRIFFRAADLKTALAMIPRMLHLKTTLRALVNPPVPYGMSGGDILVAAAAILVLLIVDVVQERTCIRKSLEKRNIVLRWGLIYACLFVVLFFGIYGPGYGASGFIYEQF